MKNDFATHHTDPASVDDREGPMADEVLRAVLVDPDALHADGAEDSRDEDLLVHFNADPLVFELVFT